MFTKDFEVRYAELGYNSALPVWTLQNYMQEAAAEDAKTLSVGWEDLYQNGVGWVLVKIQIKLLKEITDIQKVTVKTWHVSSDKIKSRRDFIILDSKGEKAAKAVSWWVIIDLHTRKITRTPENLITKPGVLNMPAMDELPETKPHISDKQPLKQNEIVSRLEDIDVNGHVNNTHFTGWAIEGIPREIRNSKRLSDILINYKIEVKDDEKIIVKTYDFENNAFWHFLIRESDGKEIASAYSRWEADKV